MQNKRQVSKACPREGRQEEKLEEFIKMQQQVISSVLETTKQETDIYDHWSWVEASEAVNKSICNLKFAIFFIKRHL
ncbi:MAG: hypothetical protein GQ529_12485 [Methyloprofundus sp.]|nr:hypothetical protein [Methyloprofundus sp.]